MPLNEPTNGDRQDTESAEAKLVQLADKIAEIFRPLADILERAGVTPVDNDEEPDIPGEWSLHIRRVNGGFVVTDQDGVETPFEESDDIQTPEDVQMVQRLLYFIVEFFGLGGSKHDAERINIAVEKKKAH